MGVGRGRPAPAADRRSDNPALLTPAGRMYLSLADWARFQRLFLNEGRPLLAEATVEHLLEVPDGGRRSMAMGWARAEAPGLSLGMQGSNTMWAATAVIDSTKTRTALIIANDGRPKVLRESVTLARDLLDRPTPTGGVHLD